VGREKCIGRGGARKCHVGSAAKMCFLPLGYLKCLMMCAWDRCYENSKSLLEKIVYVSFGEDSMSLLEKIVCTCH